jgi:hypothetical protein
VDLPATFPSMREPRDASLRVRDDLDVAGAERILETVGRVDWSGLAHAYGRARDVADQFAAAIAGDDETRDEAWWNLWGNIHHQGTIYRATVPAVDVLVGLTLWRGYPDRLHALCMLREIAVADGIAPTATEDADNRWFEAGEMPAMFAALKATIGSAADSLLARWGDEPAAVRRGLLLLVSAFPERIAEEFVDAVLPREHAGGWRAAVEGPPLAEEEADRLDAFETWVHTGA